eukprot:CAMPEP_0114643402 /NCGR_PEP_ID=MMETSP0191-20121206/3363_1 /TAXON_ID=126664 /ORGANISM="Sorites sp." /LENGTH=86 /DNA_ID=CAMNT_0001855691 /DNA_START=479 /DNA_END=736 /DNA_ORIENTATION=+
MDESEYYKKDKNNDNNDDIKGFNEDMQCQYAKQLNDIADSRKGKQGLGFGNNNGTTNDGYNGNLLKVKTKKKDKKKKRKKSNNDEP